MHANDTNKKTKIIYPKLSYKLNGLFFQVHNDLGRFCREKQYADKLEQLLVENNLEYEREFEIIKLNPDSPIGNRADFIVERKILLELKAKRYILKKDYYQIKRYIHAANIRLGMIVNFRNRYIKPKRVLNSNANLRT